MCFIERETQNFILKFREIFPWRETVLRAHGMKSDEKPVFLSNLWDFLRKNGNVVIDRYFSLFLKGWRFLLSYGKPLLTVCGLPDFKHQSHVQINFIPEDLSISTDYLLVMGQDEMVVKSLKDLSQDLCRIEPPDRETFAVCPLPTMPRRYNYATCTQDQWNDGSIAVVYKYIRGSGSTPLYINTSIVIPSTAALPFLWFKKLAVKSDGSLLAMGIHEVILHFRIKLYSFE